ncbi:hypothetical protein G5V57_17500 [Nordella sp. HKS 07]|uniref:hypothetical protein n=1 Tax=Nordella sp. HKS 07 TaxID=2712222 RepID=UPI0013E166AC|nr:hypothetical protein [Nordella sp. HKS 07]QIG49361.1 hypothetical protein G5V57_17500 [Nordella sp. HKS 07]
MSALFKNPLAYLSTSFVLFLVALPLVSIGTTSGPRILLWLGLAALCVGGLIPPVQRLLFAPKPPPAAPSHD